MKRAEWDRRIPLDFEGLRYLSAAIHLRAKSVLVEIEDRPSDDLAVTDRADPAYDSECANAEEEHKRLLREARDEETQSRWNAEDVCAEERHYERAKSLRFKDFRFRWDHLRDHKRLIGYITDDVPDWARTWDRETPICERREETLIQSLVAILDAECERLLRDESEPLAMERDDLLFHLCIWKLCELERVKGHPRGRRWDDGLENATSYAWSLYDEASKSGTPISKEEAFRRSLQEFEIISASQFDAAPDKGQVIVSDAGGKGGPVEGVLKRMRALWNQWVASGQIE